MPSKAGGLVGVLIVNLVEASAINGLPLDFLIEGQLTRAEPIRQFGVVFSEEKPQREYPIPVLWFTNDAQRQGWL